MKENIMNTLSKEITLSILGPGGYEKLTQHWSQKIKEGHHFTSFDHLLYAALRGKDWRKGYSVPNAKKLESRYRGPHLHDLAVVHSSWRETWMLTLFDGILTLESLGRLRQLLPKSSGLADSAYREIPNVVAA